MVMSLANIINQNRVEFCNIAVCVRAQTSRFRVVKMLLLGVFGRGERIRGCILEPGYDPLRGEPRLKSQR